MSQIFISIGSNIEPQHHMSLALDELQQLFGSLQVSSIFESQAVGFDGDNFLNAVVGCQTELTLEQTANALREIEVRHGRPKNAKKFASRGLDLDLLLFDAVECQQPVILPRPEIFYNAFVLWPLSELAPELIPPSSQRSFGQLWQEFDKTKQQLWPVSFHWQPTRVNV